MRKIKGPLYLGDTHYLPFTLFSVLIACVSFSINHSRHPFSPFTPFRGSGGAFFASTAVPPTTISEIQQRGRMRAQLCPISRQECKGQADGLKSDAADEPVGASGVEFDLGFGVFGDLSLVVKHLVLGF